MTLLETVLALAVMTVAVSMFSSMVVATSRQRVTNHEYPVASEAVRVTLERMRNRSFEEVFALYNADPTDDPDGPGTGPGHRFAVTGLAPLDDAPGGFVGEIVFPALADGLGGIALREDTVDALLGMPRDLNGDSLVDDLDHAADYTLLPVRVVVRWKGKFGSRRLQFHSMLAEFRK